MGAGAASFDPFELPDTIQLGSVDDPYPLRVGLFGNQFVPVTLPPSLWALGSRLSWASGALFPALIVMAVVAGSGVVVRMRSAPHTFGWVEIYHRAGSKTFFALGFQGGSTKVTLKHIWQPTGFRSWLNGQFYRRRNAHRMFSGLINNVRKALTR